MKYICVEGSKLFVKEDQVGSPNCFLFNKVYENFSIIIAELLLYSFITTNINKS